ncbi:MAG: SpoIIE family protein phosphatase [bacterium]|jgi:serine phosphatase RsbU (regulator of sigma subunit)|nr:SpoIIE family protein phosphatase [bacterium]
MNKIYFLLILLVLIVACTLLQKDETKSVQIRIIPESLPADSQIFLTGNRSELGDWDSAGLSLDRQADGSWTTTLTLPAGTNIEYKITRGSLQTVAVARNGNDLSNFQLDVKRDATISINVAHWRDEIGAVCIILADSSWQPEDINLNSNWKYHPGDDPSWADPALDDSGWDLYGPTIRYDELPKSGWQGIGWFRLHVQVDSALWNKSLAMFIRQRGASEVFIDGQLTYTFGKVGRTQSEERRFEDRNPQVLIFSPQPAHVIAVRYSSFSVGKFLQSDDIGFSMSVTGLSKAIAWRTESLERDIVSRIILTMIPAALALLHLLLFVFYTRFKENLYYAICMIGFAVLGFFRNTANADSVVLWSLIQAPVVNLTVIFGLLTAYELRYRKFPGRMWLYMFMGTALSIWGFFQWNEATSHLTDVFKVIALLEIIASYLPKKSESKLLKKDQASLWIIGIGISILALFVFYDLLVTYNVIAPKGGYTGTYIYGVVAMSISMSIYLSQRFAWTNTDLERQLVQVKDLSQRALEQERHAREEEIVRRLLEADNSRKTQELDEARKLQLSMLPRILPAIPHLDIAVYMKTATEVGGDYYDFAVGPDGTLTVAIGDATGHGAKAGTMVAIAKSLFHEFSTIPEIVEVFEKSTSSIKRLNLGALYMAMMLVKIKDQTMVASSAGMPTPLIYRAATGEVEDLELKGMPLGSFNHFPYNQKELQLSPGDTVVLMSDGFLERFNDEMETLEDYRVKEIIKEVGDKSPQEIIDHLSKESEAWANGRPQNDDVTFVVLKVKRDR